MEHLVEANWPMKNIEGPLPRRMSKPASYGTTRRWYVCYIAVNRANASTGVDASQERRAPAPTCVEAGQLWDHAEVVLLRCCG